MTEKDNQTKRVCPACGREMRRVNTWFECSNKLCDYTEDAEDEPREKDVNSREEVKKEWR